ncbi:hypothetical protein ANCCEY_09453 [Ancylostoma ceylanicum]|uniref:Uncharacterized protein n=1 Tax=Ancylostoma ceylanicum TaxID=53326 RepID=A0A0D6LHC1_9BILA|nr:hypothetical protein ANCCEY_09453 [Ancylostoma ceylanicum]
MDIVKQIEVGNNERTTVKLFDDLSNTICKAADLVGLNTYTSLYHMLKRSKLTEADRLDDVDKRTIDLFLNEFELSGVHLPDEKEQELRKLVCYRDELAKLTGYTSYAHRAQDNALLGTYENAHDFLWGVIQERAYGTAHYREANKFLTLGNILTGFANLVNKLYGVRLEEQPIERGEMWHGHIIKLVSASLTVSII